MKTYFLSCSSMNFWFIFLIILSLYEQVVAFSYQQVSIQSITYSSRHTQLFMRQPYLNGKHVSKRTYFHFIRDLVNKEVEKQGLNKVIEPEFEFYGPAISDGKQFTDCPFTQFNQMLLLHKQVDYRATPVLSTNIPSILTKSQSMTPSTSSTSSQYLPALVHKGIVITGPMKIAEYLEHILPDHSLIKSSTGQTTKKYHEIIDQFQSFYPLLTKYLINNNQSLEEMYAQKIDSYFNELDLLLRSTPGQYICGLEKTIADYYLLPQLYIAFVCLDHYKGMNLFLKKEEIKRPALIRYLKKMFSLPEFNHKNLCRSINTILHSWNQQREVTNALVYQPNQVLFD